MPPLTSPKISAFPTRNSEFSAWSGNSQKTVRFQLDLLDFFIEGSNSNRGYKYNLIIKCWNLSEAPIFVLVMAELYAGTLNRSSNVSLCCERVLRQAGAIRRRYSQVAKKSLSQSL